ncbi:hypothetical protein [Frankia sp. R43]|uniref:DUF7680 family protein n=1 Tax=Frankia sp. R43 TaxID=269536 RepID=UPI0006CA511D|nr:hypothetical protein [Frankia sp. R43]
MTARTFTLAARWIGGALSSAELRGADGPGWRGLRLAADSKALARGAREAIHTAVRASGHPASVLGSRTPTPIPLEEEAGVRLALVLATQVTGAAQAERIAQGIAGMSTEETYYWYARVAGYGQPAVQALRLLAAAAPVVAGRR